MTQVNLETIIEMSMKIKQAVKESNIPEITKLVESGAPTDLEIGGVPLILYAAQRDLWNVVEELFILNTDMDTKYDVLNWALIHQLSLAGKSVELENYLPYMNSKNIKEDSKGQNALMIAAEAKHYSTFKVLMAAGVELRSVDKEGNNVLHYVARLGWIDILKEVASKHIQLFSLPNKNGETVMSITGMKLSDFGKDDTVSILEDTVELKKEQTEVEVQKVEVSAAKSKLSKVKKMN